MYVTIGNCEIPNGQTVLGDDTEVVIQKCNSLHCFQYTMSYSIPLSKIVAFIESSENCSQSIKMECSSAPYTVSKITQSLFKNSSNADLSFLLMYF